MSSIGKTMERWVCDSEWGFLDHRVNHESAWQSVVFCAVGLDSGARLHFWGRDPTLSQFIRNNEKALFIAHNVIAEMKYLMRLGCPMPSRWFDTFLAERQRTNAPNNLEAGLQFALSRHRLSHLLGPNKNQLRSRILNLEFDSDDPRDRRAIIEYCLADCDACAALYRMLEDSSA